MWWIPSRHAPKRRLVWYRITCEKASIPENRAWFGVDRRSRVWVRTTWLTPAEYFNAEMNGLTRETPRGDCIEMSVLLDRYCQPEYVEAMTSIACTILDHHHGVKP